MNFWQRRLCPAFMELKTALSNGWVWFVVWGGKQNICTEFDLASLIVFRVKCELCPSITSSTGLAGGRCIMNCFSNQVSNNSASMKELLLTPKSVSARALPVSPGFNRWPLNIINGGIGLPAAFAQFNAVTFSPLSPLVLAWTVSFPFLEDFCWFMDKTGSQFHQHYKSDWAYPQVLLITVHRSSSNFWKWLLIRV